MLSDKIKEAETSEHSVGSNGGWFKVKEGMNSLRILSEPEIMFEDFKMGICYHNCGYHGNAKYLTHVLDRADGKVKLYKIPYGIFQTIAGFEKDEDYGFDGFPMPYDIKINAINAGTKEVKYTVIPSPKTSPVGDEVLDVLSKQKPCKEIIGIFQEKNIEKHKGTGYFQEQQKALEELATSLAQGGSLKPEESVEYPEDDVNPEDIPF